MSPQFHERLATIPEQFQQTQADLTRERAAMNQTWAKREKQMETIVSSTAKFTGELQALYGSSLPEFPQFWLFREPIQNHGQMQDQEVKTPVYRVRHAIFTVKAEQSRLCHDRAIQGGNGVRPHAAAKQGKFHRICSAAAVTRVNAIGGAGIERD